MEKENMYPNTLAMIPSRMMKVPSNPIGGGGGETWWVNIFGGGNIFGIGNMMDGYNMISGRNMMSLNMMGGNTMDEVEIYENMMGDNMMSNNMMDRIEIGYNFSFGCCNNTESDKDILKPQSNENEGEKYGKIVFFIFMCSTLYPLNYIKRALTRWNISLIPFLFTLIIFVPVSTVFWAPYGVTYNQSLSRFGDGGII